MSSSSNFTGPPRAQTTCNSVPDTSAISREGIEKTFEDAESENDAKSLHSFHSDCSVCVASQGTLPSEALIAGAADTIPAVYGAVQVQDLSKWWIEGLSAAGRALDQDPHSMKLYANEDDIALICEPEWDNSSNPRLTTYVRYTVDDRDVHGPKTVLEWNKKSNWHRVDLHSDATKSARKGLKSRMSDCMCM